MKRRSMMLLCLAGLLGCTTEQRQASSDTATVFLEQNESAYMSTGRAATAAPSAIALHEAFDPKEYSGSGVQPPPTTLPDNVANMVIRTAKASMEVDSLEPAIVEVKQLAARLGGYVANSGIEAGKNRLRQASLELKVPATRFEEILPGLTPVGKLETVNVSAQDVGEEYVDVTARMENARRLERRFIELLANRTGRLKDVLDVEQALARVREEIERYEGRMRYLRAHTAMSTFSVYVHEPVPILATTGRSAMGEAFRQAWRNFVTLASVAVQSLGVIVPLGIVAAVAWILTRRLRLAKQRTA